MNRRGDDIAAGAAPPELPVCVELRDRDGTLITRVSLATCSKLLEAGKARLLGKGARRYLQLLADISDATWLKNPKSNLTWTRDRISNRPLASEFRHTSVAQSWATTSDAAPAAQSKRRDR